MEIVQAGAHHLDAAVACLVDAFVRDPQMAYFFPGDPHSRVERTREFFKILMEARLALGMPAQVFLDEGSVVGASMGYDVQRPNWPSASKTRMSELELGQKGLAERFAQAEAIMASLEPKVPHYYLGVIGVARSAQGRGVGGALLRSFLRLSDQDELSHGTFLETANPLNLEYYIRFGFKIVGESKLDAAASLWCLFRSRLG
jgi:ribosomal protein S18 acetylase RimI-like enzyme